MSDVQRYVCDVACDVPCVPGTDTALANSAPTAGTVERASWPVVVALA